MILVFIYIAANSQLTLSRYKIDIDIDIKPTISFIESTNLYKNAENKSKLKTSYWK